MYVMSGRLSITIDNTVHFLDPGDTISYAGRSLRSLPQPAAKNCRSSAVLRRPHYGFPKEVTIDNQHSVYSRMNQQFHRE